MRPYEHWTESYLESKLFESNYDLFERRLATHFPPPKKERSSRR
jgi:hypothetical protein